MNKNKFYIDYKSLGWKIDCITILSTAILAVVYFGYYFFENETMFSAWYIGLPFAIECVLAMVYYAVVIIVDQRNCNKN